MLSSQLPIPGMADPKEKVNCSKSKAVQSTNDSSIVSKLSMSEAGYFRDPFLKHFVSKPAQRTSLINRGYYVRAAAISQVLTSFVDIYSCKGSSKVQIISLGAGFDTSFFRLIEQGKWCKYIEIDFPQVIDRKLSLLRASPILNSMINETSDNGKPHLYSYLAVGCDLRDLASLHQVLIKKCDIDYSLPTLLLSECVLTYVETSKVNSLLEWCSKSFANAVFCTYEQIHPDDGFGQIMQKHFTSLGSSLKNVNSFPTRKVQESRYLESGWDVCTSCDMNNFFFSLPLSEQRRVNNLQLFDEFEEWHLKCCHYMLLCAASGSCVESVSTLLPSVPAVDANILENHLEIYSLPVMKDSITPARYAHASVQLSTGEIVMLCGFGRSQSSGVHARLSDVIVMSPTVSEEGEKQWQCETMDTVGNRPGSIMHHRAVLLSDNRVMVFGGRTSPAKANGSFYLVKFPGSNKAEFENIVLSSDSTQMEPRWRHSLNTLSVRGCECVVIVGGLATSKLALDDCYSLDTTTWTLSKLPISLPEERHSHCALTYAGRVVIIGGLNSDLKPLSSCLQLTCDPSTGWTISPIEFTPLLPGRYSMSGCVCGDDGWLVGGVSLESGPEILRLNLAERTWIGYSIKSSICGSPILLHNHTTHLVNDREIVVLGGGGNCFSFGTHFNSHPFLVRLPA